MPPLPHNLTGDNPGYRKPRGRAEASGGGGEPQVQLAQSAERPPSYARPVVADDGQTITLALYRGDELAGLYALPPFVALAVASDLLAAARIRFGQVPARRDHEKDMSD